MPECLYFGPNHDKPAAPVFPDRLVRPASPDLPVPFSLFPQHGRGFAGEPALSGSFGEGAWETDLKVIDVAQKGTSLQFFCRDATNGLELRQTYQLDELSGLLKSSCQLTNTGDRPYALSRLSAFCLPLPNWITQLQLFRGTWASEGYLEKIPLFCGKVERNSRQGRPGFDWPQFALLTEQNTAYQSGKAIGLHLGWSGNHQFILETNGHGESQIQMSEWLAPGEITLSRGETYVTPAAYVAVSDDGLNGVSQKFHDFLRHRQASPDVKRPIHLNTWEGVYFDVDQQSVVELATAAAGLGVERFILDDGWFKGRDDDTASLGDWKPDTKRFPDGLAPVIKAVNDLGMSFGLWVEPEMVSPDSDLSRKQPDWILRAPGFDQVTGRNQLVLALTNPSVQDFVFTTVSGLLENDNIGYLKWDCNRSLYPGSNVAGPVYRKQVQALYGILARLKKQHPNVTIESCASGGGRIDFGILEYTDRVWPSDNTDAIERIRIQRNLSLFLPPEFIGSHVGPSPYEMTGRSLPMAFRCLVALFGHFGTELDPRKLSTEDAEIFRTAAQIYKEHRALLHEGRLLHLDTDTPEIDIQLITKGHEALLRILSTEGTATAIEVDLKKTCSWSTCTPSLLFSSADTTVSCPERNTNLSIDLPAGPTGALYHLKALEYV